MRNRKGKQSPLRRQHSILIRKALRLVTIQQRALVCMEARPILEGVPKAYQFGGYFRE